MCKSCAPRARSLRSLTRGARCSGGDDGGGSGDGDGVEYPWEAARKPTTAIWQGSGRWLAWAKQLSASLRSPHARSVAPLLQIPAHVFVSVPSLAAAETSCSSSTW